MSRSGKRGAAPLAPKPPTQGPSARPAHADRGTINGHVLDLVEVDGDVNDAWIRERAIGVRAMTSYLILGVAVVGLGAAFRIGPFGWLSGLEIRAFQGESPILSGALGLALLALPVVWTLRRPRDSAHPMILGAQDVFDPTRHPRFIPSPRRQLARARTAVRANLAAAVLALAAGVLGCFLSQRPGPDAGKPLPILTGAELLASGARLPPYARIVGLVDQPRAAWKHDRQIRQTHYRDLYVPLTGPSWRPGDPVDVLEKDDLLPDDPPLEGNQADPPGPREGALQVGVAPWLVKAMGASGVAVAARPVVLERKPLHGAIPGPDWVVGLVWLDVTLPLGLATGLLAWRMSRRVATLRTSAPDAERGPHV